MLLGKKNRRTGWGYDPYRVIAPRVRAEEQQQQRAWMLGTCGIRWRKFSLRARSPLGFCWTNPDGVPRMTRPQARRQSVQEGLRWLASGVPDPGFAEVDSDDCLLAQTLSERGCRASDVNIVQKRKQVFARLWCAFCLQQGAVLRGLASANRPAPRLQFALHAAARRHRKTNKCSGRDKIVRREVQEKKAGCKSGRYGHTR